LPVAFLSGALAVLIAFGAVMTWLYLDRDRAVAARTTELNTERTRLAELQHRADDLSAQLKTAQANAPDPQGYQLIKACVWKTYYDRQSEQRILTQQPGVSELTMSDLQIDPKTGKVSLAASPCDDAVKYLK
jgi:hypothetical protein